MNDEDKRNQFQESVKYKFLGFLIMLLAIIPMAIMDGPLRYVLVIILLIIGIYFQRKFKCPYCGFIFDPKLKSNELVYCPHCSETLHCEE